MSTGSALAVPLSPELDQQVLEIIRNHPEGLVETLQRYQELQIQQRQTQRLEGAFSNLEALVADSPVKGKPVRASTSMGRRMPVSLKQHSKRWQEIKGSCAEIPGFSGLFVEWWFESRTH